MNLFELAEPSPVFNPRPDICANRHGGANASVDANERVAPHKSAMRRKLLEMIRASTNGLTSSEIEKVLGIPKNKFSGRLSELKDAKEIFETTARRDGCAVLRAVR